MPDDPNKRGLQDRSRESQQEYEKRYRESKKEEQSGNKWHQAQEDRRKSGQRDRRAA